MLDVFNIPGQQDNVKIFYAAGTTAWQTWQKPRNCKFIWMMCMGSGGGGAGGGGNIGGVGVGTSGGGSGGVVKALFPANVLPDILYIFVGVGGAGGAGGTASNNGAQGSTGVKSFVTITPVTIATPAVLNVVCVSGNIAAGGGFQTTGGSAESIATINNAGLLSLANFSAIAGVAGNVNPTTGPTAITPLGSALTIGGGMGGDAAPGRTTGGAISATSISPTIAGGTIGQVGGSGIVSWKPFYSLGGAGGGGVDTGTPSTLGGNGGNGAYGSGGGGGGASATGNGGAGGKGGDGLVIIATF